MLDGREPVAGKGKAAAKRLLSRPVDRELGNEW